MRPDPLREIETTRRLPHGHDRVRAAFADPAALAAWWGPHGFRNEFHAFDLRPGGAWRFDMVGPRGDRYPQDKRFLEVRPGERLVLEHRQKGHDFSMTLAFEDEGDGCRLTWRTRFEEPAELAPVRDVMVAGNEEVLDRLAAWLDGRKP